MPYIYYIASPFSPHAIIANKIDLPDAQERCEILRSKVSLPVIAVSGKEAINLDALREQILTLYNTYALPAVEG